MNEDRRPLIIAAIPVYNEEKTIAKTVLITQRYVDKVVVCDDGSSDMSAEIARKLDADVVSHEKNEGYGATIQTLFSKAKELGASVMVTLDGDGQHDPCNIPALIKPVLEGFADVVVGSRFLKDMHTKDIPLYRQIGIKAITELTKATSNSKITDAQSGFRAYSRKALEELMVHENGMGVSVEILMRAKKLGLRVMEVPIGCNYRELKTSTNNPLRHGTSVVMSIVKLVIEEKPLFFLGVPGIVFLLIGVLFGVWMLQLYAIERHIVTNIALASVAFIVIGLFSVFTAITLYAIARLMQRTSRQ